MHSRDVWLFPKLLNGTIIGTAILTIYCYLLFLILSQHNIFLKVTQCFIRSKIFLNFLKIKHAEVNVEDQALLNHDEADYNSYENH